MVKELQKTALGKDSEEALRQVTEQGLEIVIMEGGKPIARIVPYRAVEEGPGESLRGSVLRYDDETEPVGVEDWESLR